MTTLVSVVTVTYNHEPFIARCIEGVLMQKVNFPIEFIIAEDCSTDGTRTICQMYAEKHPDLIHLITSECNVGANANEFRALQEAKGKYIAYCEGDDFWTDQMKLQRQVDFLESHPDYSVCFHRCQHWDMEADSYRDDQSGDLFCDGDSGVDLSIDMFFGKWITQPLTMVFRKEAFDMSLYGQYRYYRDMHQIYHLLKKGKGYIFSFAGGIRTVHSGGMASTLDVVSQCRNGVMIAAELYERNKDQYTKKYYAEVLQWYLYNVDDLGSKIKYSFVLFSLTWDFKGLIKNLLR